MTSDPLMHPGSVVVHGVASCEDTTRARARFDAAGLPYRYVDLDRDVETRAALHARGLMATPVVVMPDGGVLVEPTDPELDGVIERHRGGART